MATSDTESLISGRKVVGLRCWRDGEQKYSKMVAFAVLALQFAVPILTASNIPDLMRSEHWQEPDVTRDALPNLKDCPQVTWQEKLDFESIANQLLGGQDYQFYSWEANKCGRRTRAKPDGYILQHQCAHNLLIRDSASCALAASAMLGLNASDEGKQLMCIRNDVTKRAEGAWVVAMGDNFPRGCSVTAVSLNGQWDTLCAADKIPDTVGFGGPYLELCFSFRKLPASILVLMVSMGLSLAVCSLSAAADDPPGHFEAGHEARQKVHTGSQRLAAKAFFGTRRALAYRFCQMLHTVWWGQVALIFYRPWVVMSYYAVLLLPLSVALYGWASLLKPLYWLVPPAGSIFQPRSFGHATKMHLIVSMLAPFIPGLTYILVTVSKATGYHYRHHTGWYRTWYDTIRNAGASQAMHMQQYSHIFFEVWSLLAALASVVYIVWTIKLLTCCCCWPAEEDNSSQLFRDLVAHIEQAASQRLLAAGTSSSNAVVDGTSQATSFPEPVKLVTMFDKTSLACFGHLWLPGALLRVLVVLLLDLVTDTYAWGKFLGAGHYLFAAFLATVAWTSTLIQMKRGFWQTLGSILRESEAAGVMTQDLVSLVDTEKNMETLVALVVQTYAFSFAGLNSLTSMCVACFSVGLSLYGLSSYVVDVVDVVNCVELK